MLGGWKFANLKDGSMAEYFHVNNAVANLAPIPDGLTDEQAAYCCDMLSTGFVAAEFGNIPIGGSVAVFGVGAVGMMAIVGARAARTAEDRPSFRVAFAMEVARH
jgi:threonine dehydrogenase-like Zn-dependent dehydrogenase